MKYLLIYIAFINIGQISANIPFEPDQDDVLLLTTQIYEDEMFWSDESGSGNDSDTENSSTVDLLTKIDHSEENPTEHTFVDFEDNSSDSTPTIDDYDSATESVTESEDELQSNDSGSGEVDTSQVNQKNLKIIPIPFVDNMQMDSDIYANAVLCDEAVNEHIKKNPNEKKLTSPNFPNPYPNHISETHKIEVYDVIGINITIHCLDIDPKSDYLFINAVIDDNKLSSGPIITGNLKAPKKFLIMDSTITNVTFMSQHESEHQFKGYALTYVGWGDIVVTPEPEVTEPPLPTDRLETIVKYLAIKRSYQNEKTWGIIRTALTMSALMFTSENKINASHISEENVLFVRILGCPDGWQDNINCISIAFGIPLVLTDDDITKYELSSENLQNMWRNYTVNLLKEQDIFEYVESSQLLLIWISISLAIVAAFLCVLYTIWRTDIFKDYRRMSSSSSSTLQLDKDESNMHNDQLDFDVSMYPSPYQKVPTLFPSNDAYSQRTAHTDSYRNPEFLPDDFPADSTPTPKTKYTSGIQSSVFMPGYNRDRDESMS